MSNVNASDHPANALAVNALYTYVGAFVDELWRSGVRHAVVCPGSRSTPLALTLAQQPRIQLWTLVDERSAAFFALGLAKGTGEPVALACTSGTAAANFFPAVVEAHLTHVPLIVLTADRPPELRDDGAPQTIDQIRLYGVHAKWFMDVPLPEATNPALRFIRTLACRAVATARGGPAGPVHLNFPFREPLTPEPGPLPPEPERDLLVWYGRPEGAPYVTVPPTLPRASSPDLIEQLAAQCQQAPHGVIIAGPGLAPGMGPSLSALAETLGWPIVADPLSGVRFGGPALQCISTADGLLRDNRFVAAARPDLVLRLGAMPTAKPVLQYLQHWAGVPVIVVDEHGDWPDPTQLASTVVHADLRQLVEGLSAALQHDGRPHLLQDPVRQRWETLWHSAEALARTAMRATMLDFPALFEGRVFLELGRLLPANATIVVSNSMPVRDADTFLWHDPAKAFKVIGNRGANGIDGVVSTALGISATQSEPIVLVIGDLAFYHDMNGLLAAKRYGLDLMIVLVNNDGGGIFSFLPQADYPEHFEQVFGTPTGLDFSHTAALYDAIYTRTLDWVEFREAVRSGLEQGGLHIVELPTDRATNVAMHRLIWPAISRALVEGEVLPVEGGTQP